MGDISSNTFVEIQRVASVRLGRDLSELTHATRASEVSGWDSFAHIDIVIALEDLYSIRFQTSELVLLQTIGELAELIKSKIG